MNDPHGARAKKLNVSRHKKQQKKLLYLLDKCHRYGMSHVAGLIYLAFLLVAGWTMCTAPVFAHKTNKQEKPIVIGVALSLPPYSYLDENGKAIGYNVDLTRAIAQVMQLDVEVRIGPWGEIRQALENGEIDAAPMFYSVERDKSVDFSVTYSVIHNAIFTHRDTPAIETEDDLFGKDIIVIRGDIMHDYVLDNGLSDDPVLVPTESDALRLLASGEHDCALMSQLPGLYWVKELELSDIVTVGPLLSPSNMCYAVKEGNASLQHLIGEGLFALAKTGELKDIRDKWLGVLEPVSIPISVILKYIAIAAVPLLLLLVFSMLWSRTLKRLVIQRTCELRESEKRFKALVTDSEEIVFMINKEGIFTLSEGKGLSVLGLRPGQVVGQSVFELYKEFPDLLNSIRKVLRGEKITIEVKVGDVYFKSWFTPHKNLEGETIGLLGLSINITEQKQSEQVIKEKVDKLERLNRVMVNRELRMIELKKELNTSFEKAGLPAKYKIPTEIEGVRDNAI